MRCPKCSDLLETRGVGEPEVTLDVCPSCEGAWFDEGELDALDGSETTSVETLGFRPAKEVDEVRYRCPRCEGDLQPLSPLDERHLVVDHCQACRGFWLDPGELDWLRLIAKQRDEAASAEAPSSSWLGSLIASLTRSDR